MSSEASKNDSFGRRTWDENEYAQKARDRYNAKKSNNHDRDSLEKMKAAKFFNERQKYIDQIDGMSKISFVSSIGANDSGFYCDVCNRKFKDNLKYIDHLNSTEHLTKSGFDMNEFIQKEVTLDQVKERLENLKRVIESKNNEPGSGLRVNLKESIEERKRFQEREKEKRRLKRSHKRQKKRENSVIEGKMLMNNEQDEMARIMGFKDFHS